MKQLTATARLRLPMRITGIPLGLTMLNQVDRFSLAIDVIDRAPRLSNAGAHVKGWLQDQILDHLAYAREHGVDPPEIRDWTWTS